VRLARRRLVLSSMGFPLFGILIDLGIISILVIDMGSNRRRLEDLSVDLYRYGRSAQMRPCRGARMHSLTERLTRTGGAFSHSRTVAFFSHLGYARNVHVARGAK